MAFDKTKYKNDFTKNNYDRLNIVVPKGYKAELEKHWKALGYKSLNDFVNALIKQDMIDNYVDENSKQD